MIALLLWLEVIVVDAAGGGDYTDIQPAVDAALAGDTVLVRAGDYSGFVIDGKGIAVVGDGPLLWHVDIVGGAGVTNLPAGETALLSRLRVEGVDWDDSTPSHHGLHVINCDGPVRVQESYFQGGAGDGTWPDPSPPIEGGHAAFVRDSDDVILNDVSTLGGRGGYTPPVGGQGGDGLHALRSTVALFDSEPIGGQGGGADFFEFTIGGTGGEGIDQRASTVIVDGSRVVGGGGGWGYFESAEGGDGVLVDATSLLRLRDSELFGGDGGYDALFSQGPSGQESVVLGTRVDLPGSELLFTVAPNPAREGELLTLDLVPNTPAFLLVSFDTSFVYLGKFKGVLAVPPPWLIDGLALSGWPIATTVPDLPAGFESVAVHLQAAVVGGGLSRPQHLTFLDDAF